ncbi:DUF4929 family protein [Flavobacterium sp. NKUCC04_CG]|uniref:DUF4929 family protein n=1 Tax=Flavobacterium sp. NKUCC04_CG TaxID=2842121 RepID=UPI001C5B17D8|nr:DUF4929 family protein [Flavobacterium sp. NKUCC04_CG]MBW3519813.1 DUF4929 domain-containing protein [Flavobacterium sp. NKUCC04_CG]
MKSNFTKRHLSFLAFLSLIVFSCAKDDNVNAQYIGENKISLSAISSSTLIDNDQNELLIDLILVKSEDQPISLEFALVDHLVNQTEIIYLEHAKITLEAGTKTAQLKIKSHNLHLLKENTSMGIVLTHSSLEGLKLDKPFRFNVKPAATMESLTAEQLALLDHYKTQGLDLYPLMGAIEVTTRVYFPGEGSIDFLTQKYERTLTGKTMISLSDKATKDKPILSMTQNAMGIESYLYELFRNLTILDTQYWLNPDPEIAQPAPRNIIDLIQLSANSNENFDLLLDDIEISLNDKKVSFIGELTNIFDDTYAAVPFKYSYTAWDRLKVLIDQGNQIALENYQQGGSVYPGHHINSDDILTDNYQNSTWKATTANLDADQLRFSFIMDHNHAAGYIRFDVTYRF